MLEDKKEPLKEAKVEVKEVSKSKAKTKSYTVIKEITLKEVHYPGAQIELEVGSDLEKNLITNKFVNKHGVSRSN